MTYPGVIIRAVLDRNSWLAEPAGHVLALGVSPVFADNSLVEWGVVVILSGNDDVVSLAITDDGFLKDGKRTISLNFPAMQPFGNLLLQW